MAQTLYHGPYYFNSVGLAPGQNFLVAWGPSNFFQRVITVTAHPFFPVDDLPPADRRLTVPYVHIHSPRKGGYYVHAAIRNVGLDIVDYFYVSMSGVLP
jgi:hypothetical protein